MESQSLLRVNCLGSSLANVNYPATAREFSNGYNDLLQSPSYATLTLIMDTRHCHEAHSLLAANARDSVWFCTVGHLTDNKPNNLAGPSSKPHVHH